MNHNQTTLLEVVVGSTLHGTKVDDGLEDLDLMAVVIEDLKHFAGFYTEDTWTFRTKPDGVRSEAGDIDYVAYGLKKFLNLATKGNPTILLALFAPPEFIRATTTKGQELQQLASSIVSKQSFAPFRGYMRQQHERLLNARGQMKVTRPELIEKFGYDTKYAAHIIRLGYQGYELLRTGRMTLPMPDEQRQRVVDVRNGKYELHQVSDMIDRAETSLAVAVEASPLPERPNLKAVEQWMLRTYLDYWKNGL